MKRYMVDTNIFSQIAEGKLQVEMLPKDSSLYVTYIQWQEIMATNSIDKRDMILEKYNIISPVMLPTGSFLAGISSAGTAGAGAGQLQMKVLKLLNSKKTRKNNSNVHDSLIGEAAIIHKMILITNDDDLRDVIAQLGGMCERMEMILS